jgi:hypothetical protein
MLKYVSVVFIIIILIRLDSSNNNYYCNIIHYYYNMDYGEKLREANIQRNAEFLSQLGIGIIKEQLGTEEANRDNKSWSSDISDLSSADILSYIILVSPSINWVFKTRGSLGLNC